MEKKKRDLVAEVLDRRSRHPKRVPRLVQSSKRLTTLENAYRELVEHKEIPLSYRKELYRHIPVALIAISEGYFRLLYSELIDLGEPFLGRIHDFRDLRLDLGALIATNQKELTIGELISHQLPHNNIGDIERNLSVILGENFSHEFTKRIVAEDAAMSPELNDVFQKNLRRCVVRTFTLRHILCHELAASQNLRQDEMGILIKVFRVYFQMLNEHVTEALEEA